MLTIVLQSVALSLPAVLKDVRNSPLDMIRDPEMDQTRMSSYPNLEYQNLYNAICMLVSLLLFWFLQTFINLHILLKKFFTQIDVTPNIQYGIQSEFLFQKLNKSFWAKLNEYF